MRRLFLSFFVAAFIFLGLQLPAYANPDIPLLQGPPENILQIRINCGNDWLETNQSRLIYSVIDPSVSNSQTLYETEVDTDYPNGSFCGSFFDLLGQDNSVPGDSSISQETLDWWQATIDILKTGITIGSRIYPVILGIRVVSMLVYT